MTLLDLFSKRQKRLRQQTPDVFVYDRIPASLRVQIVHIWKDAFGDPNQYESRTEEVYNAIHDGLAREYGVFALSNETARSGKRAGLIDFLLKEDDVERVLDAVEFSFSVLDSYCREWSFQHASNPSVTPDDALEELNARFLEAGVGFQFEGGQIIRIDSSIVHEEVVKPALSLLSDPRFSGANSEYLSAHEHYRHGRGKESLNESLKALESTLKTICQIRGWSYKPGDTAKNLIDVCFTNGLIPSFMQSQYTGLRVLLESGVPTLRNKLSGHGQGSAPQPVPQHVAAYGLHLAGSSILFLINAEKHLP